MIQYYSYPTNNYSPLPPGEPYVYYQSIYDDRYDSPYQNHKILISLLYKNKNMLEVANTEQVIVRGNY